MWTRLDDGFTEHPKVARVGLLGMGWQVAALVYCNRNLTDGFVPHGVARQLAPLSHEDGDGKLWNVAATCGMQGHDGDQLVSEIIGWLLDAGMWEQVPGGFQIHDFPDYNLTKEQVLERREVRSESGRKGGLARAKANAKPPAKQTPKPTSSNGSSKPSSKTLANSYPVPVPVPDPVPTPKPEPLGTTSTATAPDGAGEWDDRGFDPAVNYFVHRLRDGDEGWNALSPTMLRRLIKHHGPGTVATALGYLREAPGSEPVRNPVALVETMCQQVASEAVSTR